MSRVAPTGGSTPAAASTMAMALYVPANHRLRLAMRLTRRACSTSWGTAMTSLRSSTTSHTLFQFGVLVL